MDKEQFDLVDGVLGDGREIAKTILKAQGDNMQMGAEVIGRRFGLRPEAVLGWFAEKSRGMNHE